MAISRGGVWIGIGSFVDVNSQLYKELCSINKVLVDDYGGFGKVVMGETFHLNIYDLDIPENKLDEVVLEINKVLKNKPIFMIKIVGVDCFEFGVFFVKLGLSKQLIKLQKEIVEVVNSFRDGMISPDYLRWEETYSDGEKNLLRQYGNPHVLSQYQPHITIGKVIKGENFGEIKKDLNGLLRAKEFVLKNIELVVKKDEDSKISVVREYKMVER